MEMSWELIDPGTCVRCSFEKNMSLLNDSNWLQFIMEPCSPQEDQDLSEALAASRAAFQAGSVEA